MAEHECKWDLYTKRLIDTHRPRMHYKTGLFLFPKAVTFEPPFAVHFHKLTQTLPDVKVDTWPHNLKRNGLNWDATMKITGTGHV